MEHKVIGFTGTQRGMTSSQRQQFEMLFNQLHIEAAGEIEFHHGDCIGADEDAHNIVAANTDGYGIWLHPPMNDKKRAWCRAYHVLPIKDYMNRNHDIVEACDILIACPKGMTEELRSGTWATIRYARILHKRVQILWPCKNC